MYQVCVTKIIALFDLGAERVSFHPLRNFRDIVYRNIKVSRDIKASRIFGFHHVNYTFFSSY